MPKLHLSHLLFWHDCNGPVYKDFRFAHFSSLGPNALAHGIHLIQVPLPRFGICKLKKTYLTFFHAFRTAHFSVLFRRAGYLWHHGVILRCTSKVIIHRGNLENALDMSQEGVLPFQTSKLPTIILPLIPASFDHTYAHINIGNGCVIETSKNLFSPQQTRHSGGQLPHAHPALRSQRGQLSQLRRDGSPRRVGATQRREPRAQDVRSVQCVRGSQENQRSQGISRLL